MRSFLLFFIGFSTLLKGQYYYPPVSGPQWDTVNPASLGWCTSQLDTLSEFVEDTHAKGFIILHNGKIAFEEYYSGFTQDSLWYWASAGKSLTAFLVGMAQQQTLLNINDKTSDYLGAGWTSATAAKENLITIKEQLRMTTGLDYTVSDLNCIEDTCLLYKNNAGTYWYYHNAPYRLLQDVVTGATNLTFNQFTFQQLNSATGITGLWLNYVFFSNARSMARFGLLALSEGVWNGNPVLADSAYFYDMVHPSQNFNEAYGYLWWLNGQSTYRQPGIDLAFNGSIIPSAPADLYMAAGKNDQRIYVVPSENLVVVRVGDAADQSLAALSGFDDDLWKLMSALLCQNTEVTAHEVEELKVYPNPAGEEVTVHPWEAGDIVEIYNMSGQLLKQSSESGRLRVASLREGMYLLKLNTKQGMQSTLLLIH
ncbi:MAG: serine hydrolase [Owenweeksia sp.]